MGELIRERIVGKNKYPDSKKKIKKKSSVSFNLRGLLV